jgi:acylphosphatase
VTDLRLHRLVISGRVQGVGYRDWLTRLALTQGVTGWVRNRRDGSVEAVLAGSPDAVARLCEACTHGPHNAVVTGIDIGPADATDLRLQRAGEAFSRLPTA